MNVLIKMLLFYDNFIYSLYKHDEESKDILKNTITHLNILNKYVLKYLKELSENNNE